MTICCLLVLFSFSIEMLKVEASSYDIHIIKLGLRDTTKLPNDFISNGIKVDEVKDADGNVLNGVSSISYTITRMALKTSDLDPTKLDSYEIVTGKEAFTQTVTTNQDGEAQVTGLPKGVYQVSELPNKLLSHVMEPVLISLPLESKHGLLSEVYVYPKSSLASNTPDEPELPNKLPQTSGNIGKTSQFYWMIGLIGGMGFLGVRQFKKLS
ncbi:pilin N-terminal domain-containing protein [Vagococcus martis]|uniref:pilin N-terminal domain-containing protein n=1 Tax=Vagococcus martis TaxID=1768210 RepID=UPI0011809786|nr:pilin N-terminal domain-containing protein [Vagococcus martis]